MQYGDISSGAAVFMAKNPTPLYPSEGLHILQPQLGDIVDTMMHPNHINHIFDQRQTAY